MCATCAGTPSFSRRKSITRYRRLLPPPWWRVVTRPWVLRPARFRPLATSERSGLERVTSSNEDTLAPRRPGVVGLYFRTAIWLLSRLEDLDAVALGELDDRALLVGALAQRVPATLDLAGAVQRANRGHLDVPDRLDGLLDLGLVRPRVHEERVGVLLQAGVGLLAHDRADDDVSGGLHSPSPSSGVADAAPSGGSSPVESVLGSL